MSAAGPPRVDERALGKGPAPPRPPHASAAPRSGNEDPFMSHHLWSTCALGLLVAAGARAQDLSGGFTDALFPSPVQVADEVFAWAPLAVADLDENGLPDIAVQDTRTKDVAIF